MALELEEIRGMSPDELAVKIEELKKQLLNLRVQHHTGKLEKHHELELLKRDIARAKTIQNQSKSQNKKGVQS